MATRKQENSEMTYTPKFSLIVPVYNADAQLLKKMVDSVYGQKYSNWELCICDDDSTKEETRNFLSQISNQDKKIRVIFSKHNEGISIASNRALELATGDFIGLLDNDDELSPDALSEVAGLLNKVDADMIYTDEDKITEDGKHFDPAFKPDWSPDFLLSCMYVNHLTVYRRKIIEELGGFRKEFDGSQDHDLALRVSEKTKKIYHIPKVLYHWRATGDSNAFLPVGTKAHLAGLRAVESALRRRSEEGTVEQLPAYLGYYQVRYKIKSRPLVSIIIPTKDRIEFLQECVNNIEKKSTYDNYEIIIVDNGSTSEKTREYLSTLRHVVLLYDKPFNFSAMNNIAVKEAKGEFIIFLNNDTRVISNDWIEKMLEYAQRPDVGAVGCKLLYPNGKVQHAGILLGVGGISFHAFHGFPSNHLGYLGLLQVTHNCSAVTAACMMINKKLFLQQGGFDENLAVKFNDIDLCLRMRKNGYLIVFIPHVMLYHKESGTANMSTVPQERSYFLKKWDTEIKAGDPYYNLNLNHEKPDYTIAKDHRRDYYFYFSSPLDRFSSNYCVTARRYVWFGTNILRNQGPKRLVIEFFRFLKLNLRRRTAPT